jgi:glycosyltransferase involved in cell wall biosynthesis
MRLAWFSPWPPQASGVAGRSAVVVDALAAAGAGIDVFVDARRVTVAGRTTADPPAPGAVRVLAAHDAVWRLGRRSYDLVVYQLGNSRLHDYIWPYLFRWPGLTVLHDARLHHARGAALLGRGRHADYRAEFAFNHPDAPADAAELAVAGFDGPYYSLWPMTRAVIEASRAVGVHTRGGAADLAASRPDRLIEYLPLGEGRRVPLAPAERTAMRATLGLGPSDVAFGVFGALTADKRVPQILRTFARTHRYHPHARLVLAGAPDPAVDVAAAARALGITDVVRHLDVLDDEAFDRAIAAVDASLHLRWPSAVETSGPWLRALAASRATVVIDLPHQAHVPALDPRTWRPPHGGGRDPVTVAVDILDEEHSLALAMHRLAGDAALRDRLGVTARRYWALEHTDAHMIDAYRALLDRARACAMPDPILPSHLRPDPLAHTRDLLLPFPEVSCALP